MDQLGTTEGPFARSRQTNGTSSAAAPSSETASPDASAAKITPCAPRLSLLIRAAKLVTSHGEFVCVVRDISATGIGVRLFHDAPWGDPVELHMPSGAVCELRQMRANGREVGYEFVSAIDVGQFVDEIGPYPKRGLRLGLSFPAVVTAHAKSVEAIVSNLSQQGARIECDGSFALDQALRIEGDDDEVSFGPVSAKVRWRRDDCYGVVFEDTLTLPDFAQLAAQLQCPALLEREQA